MTDEVLRQPDYADLVRQVREKAQGSTDAPFWRHVADAIERLAAPAPECKCDLRTKLVGDGCEVCNPELAKELAAAPAPDAATVDQIMSLAALYATAFANNSAAEPEASRRLRAAVEQLEQRALAAEHSATVAKSACLALGERWERAEAERDALRALLVEARVWVEQSPFHDPAHGSDCHVCKRVASIDAALKPPA